MRREFHVRFCEGLGVRSPRATRLVVVCALEHDAHRIQAVLRKRMARFGLTVHPEKTRLISFKRPPRDGPKEKSSFDLLGFTHFWARSRKGRWIVKRKTSKKSFRQTVKRAAMWCRVNRHRPIPEQHRRLCRMLRGHDAYFGITGNSTSLQRLRIAFREAWRAWLNRRSSNSSMDWDKFNKLLRRYPLPGPRAVHSVLRLPQPA